MAKKHEQFTRRKFLQSTSVGLSLGVWAGTQSTATAASSATRVRPRPREKRLPREVWVATVSQNGMQARSYEEMIKKILGRMQELISYEPDIICLPEVFPFANLSSGRPPVSQVAEVPIGDISRPFAEFARKHGCNIVCPIYTKENGHYYNSAVFMQPVFKTDFGIVGVQICFDIEWNDGWQKLRQAGAEIVFWPSAFAGGMAVNAKAWQNKFVVVSSTRKDTSKICDISGEVVASTGRWNDWVCAPVNLEKAFLHTWPFCQRFDEVQAKYGRGLRITTFHEEEWTIIESCSADVRVADVLKEFEFQAYEDFIQAADAMQRKHRK